jgi:RND family efflux transporter MFP subunit
LLVALLAGGAAAQGVPADLPMTCIIEPDEVIELSTPVAGVIAAMHVERGQRVARGSLVAELDTSVERATVALTRKRAENGFTIAAREARLAFLDRRRERNEQLAARSAISRAEAEEAMMEMEVALQELEEARLDREVAALELAQAEAQLAQKILRSPIDGVVTERRMSVGEYRSEESHVVTIVSLDPLRVEVIAPLPFYGRIVPGQTAVIRPEPPVGGAHAARVSVVDPVLDAGTGTFGIRLDLPNPDLAIPAGVRCAVAFNWAQDR